MSIPTIQRYRASILLATLLVHLFAFWLTKNRSGLKILTLATEPCSRVNKSVSTCCTSHRNTKRSRKSFWLWLFYVTWSFRQWIMSFSFAVPYSKIRWPRHRSTPVAGLLIGSKRPVLPGLRRLLSWHTTLFPMARKAHPEGAC